MIGKYLCKKVINLHLYNTIIYTSKGEKKDIRSNISMKERKYILAAIFYIRLFDIRLEEVFSLCYCPISQSNKMCLYLY